SRSLRQYRSRQRSARLFPKGSFPCAPDYFCLVCLLNRCQTYAVRLHFQWSIGVRSNEMNPPSQYSTIPSLHRSVLVQRISKSASLIAAALFLQLPANLEGKELISEGDVVVVPLRGEVAPSLLAFLRRAVKTAESNEASAIIFDMNTYGGRLDTATDIVNALNQTKIPSYTFINKDKEVRIGDRVVHPKGAVLTLNAQEATERINGKPLLAEGVADSVSDLIKKAGLKGNEVTIEPTGFEQIAFWITALAPLLLLGGILGAYLEFKIPGVTWPGVISAICFALFFLGHY